MGRPRRPIDAHDFWLHVNTRLTIRECWEWAGRKGDSGHGWYRGKPAHRVAFELINGPLPPPPRRGVRADANVVRHCCDNPGCVNPRHLVLGTATDNMRDRDRSRQLLEIARRIHGVA